MKTLILSTIAATAIALSAGTALASGNSSDYGYDILLQSLNSPTRHRRASASSSRAALL